MPKHHTRNYDRGWLDGINSERRDTHQRLDQAIDDILDETAHDFLTRRMLDALILLKRYRNENPK